MDSESRNLSETGMGSRDVLGSVERAGTKSDTGTGTGREFLSQKSVENRAGYGRFRTGSEYSVMGGISRKKSGEFQAFPVGYGRKTPEKSKEFRPEYCVHKITVNPGNRPFPGRTVRTGNCSFLYILVFTLEFPGILNSSEK